MRWRQPVALAVLGLGWVVWLIDLAGRTPAADPKHVTILAKLDAGFSKARQRGEYPNSGVIGYRDDIDPDTPETMSRRNQRYLLFQYVVAPVVIDRVDRRDLTFVLTPTYVYLEKTRNWP